MFPCGFQGFQGLGLGGLKGGEREKQKERKRKKKKGGWFLSVLINGRRRRRFDSCLHWGINKLSEREGCSSVRSLLEVRNSLIHPTAAAAAAIVIVIFLLVFVPTVRCWWCTAGNWGLNARRSIDFGRKEWLWHNSHRQYLRTQKKTKQCIVIGLSSRLLLRFPLGNNVQVHGMDAWRWTIDLYLLAETMVVNAKC